MYERLSLLASAGPRGDPDCSRGSPSAEIGDHAPAEGLPGEYPVRRHVVNRAAFHSDQRRVPANLPFNLQILVHGGNSVPVGKREFHLDKRPSVRRDGVPPWGQHDLRRAACG